VGGEDRAGEIVERELGQANRLDPVLRQRPIGRVAVSTTTTEWTTSPFACVSLRPCRRLGACRAGRGSQSPRLSREPLRSRWSLRALWRRQAGPTDRCRQPAVEAATARTIEHCAARASHDDDGIMRQARQVLRAWTRTTALTTSMAESRPSATNATEPPRCHYRPRWTRWCSSRSWRTPGARQCGRTFGLRHRHQPPLNQIRNLTTPGRQRGELRLCGLNRWVVLLWDDRYGVNLHERARASVSCGRNAVMGQGTSEPLVYVSAGQGLAHLG